MINERRKTATVKVGSGKSVRFCSTYEFVKKELSADSVKEYYRSGLAIGSGADPSKKSKIFGYGGEMIMRYKILKTKKSIVLLAFLVITLVGSTIASAAVYPTSMAGKIGPGTSWQNHYWGMKRDTGSGFKLTNYEGYGPCSRTAFAVRMKRTLDGQTEKVWGGDTNSTGRINKSGSQRYLSFNQSIRNGYFLLLRYKIPSDEPYTSDTAYVEYYWFR